MSVYKEMNFLYEDVIIKQLKKEVKGAIKTSFVQDDLNDEFDDSDAEAEVETEYQAKEVDGETQESLSISGKGTTEIRIETFEDDLDKNCKTGAKFMVYLELEHGASDYSEDFYTILDCRVTEAKAYEDFSPSAPKSKTEIPYIAQFKFEWTARVPDENDQRWTRRFRNEDGAVWVK